jgi:hypothetical protein
MLHINCGMTGIARYNAWLSPLLIFFVITQTGIIIKHFNIKRIFYIGSCVSVLYSSIIFFSYGGFNTLLKTEYGGGAAFTPVAKLVVERFPALYNPFQYTFVCRVLHVDGGYFYNEPVYYKSEDNLIKKILVTPQTASNVYKDVYGDTTAMKSLTQQINQIKNSTGFRYINITSGNLYYQKHYTSGDIINFTNSNNTSYLYNTNGFGVNEGDGTWTSSVAEIMLPLAENLKQYSKLEVNLREFDSVKYVEIYVNGNLIGTINRNSTFTTYNFNIPDQYLKNDQLDIMFKVNGAATPASIGMGTDSRILGIQISKISIK